ncbi:hypothetical protein BDR05DRAFT_968758 [Suillus weaverae]|nr:hypothetical protein BDR05DRAFT_968758 [Suillus weaverae]
MRESSSLDLWMRTDVLWGYSLCVSSLVYLLSPEFMSEGLFTRGRYSTDSPDNFGTIYAGDIPQYQSVGGPIFSSLQLLLLETTRVSLTTKPHLEQTDADLLHARTREGASS